MLLTWKNSSRLFLLLPLILLLFNCSPSREEKTEVVDSQVFRMNFHSEPSSLDPRLIKDIPTVTCAKMLFDGLMRKNLQGEIVPSVALKVVASADKKNYLFFLRESYWSNGLPVTAYDFEYAWKSILSSQISAEYAYQLFAIKNALPIKKGLLSTDELGVHVIDPRTLYVQLENPDPYFLELMAFPISFPIPKEIASKEPEWAAFQGEDFICNGPFQLFHWNHTSELRAKKNLSYWDQQSVLLQEIVLSMVQDEHTELNMYENSELDWAGSPNSSIPPEALPTLKNRKSDELFIFPIAATFCYKFNTKTPPFHESKMRQAFALAINRKLLVENILQANQLVASSLLPPALQPTKSALFSDENREAALTLFEEALESNGWTRETLPPITLIFSKSEKHQKLAQAVQQQWNEIFNIKVHLQSYEWNIFLQLLAKGEYQVGGKGCVSDISDPKLFLETYSYANSANNETGWENITYRELIQKSAFEENGEKKAHYLKEAEKILFTEMPIAPLYHSTACYLKKPYVKNVFLSPFCDLDLKYAYIER